MLESKQYFSQKETFPCPISANKKKTSPHGKMSQAANNSEDWALRTYMDMQLEESLHCLPLGTKPKTVVRFYTAEGSKAWARRHGLLKIWEDGSLLPKHPFPVGFTHVQCNAFLCKHWFFADFYTHDCAICPMCASPLRLPKNEVQAYHH
jgi:hypothetical protein